MVEKKPGSALGKDPFEDLEYVLPSPIQPPSASIEGTEGEERSEPSLGEMHGEVETQDDVFLRVDGVDEFAAAEIADWLTDDLAPVSQSLEEELPETDIPPAPFADHYLPLPIPPSPPTDDHTLDDVVAAIDQETSAAAAAMPVVTRWERGAAVSKGAQQQYVVFALDDTEYAVPFMNVLQTDRPLKVTPVPNTPDWVLGVSNLRGDIISMVDLRAFWGMAPSAHGPGERMLVARTAHNEMILGLIVDQVRGIRSLALHLIQPPAAPIDDPVAPYLSGIYSQDGRKLVVLDFERMLLSPEMRQFEPL